MMTKQKTRGASPCSVSGCGRPAYAKGMCQTHHRQMLQTGKTKPIRPYRERTKGTVKLVGFRVSAECADLINSTAAKRGLSLGAVISDVLEDWNSRSDSPGSSPKRGRKRR